MATNSKRDVQLVIRAKDEASKAVASIAAVLDQLAAAQVGVQTTGSKTGSTITQLAEAVGAVEKVFGRTAAAADQAAASFARQKATLRETEAQYDALRSQAHAAEVAVLGLEIAMKNGGDAGTAARLAGANAAYRELVASVDRAESAVARQRTALASSADALGSTRNAASAAGLALATFGDEAERAGLQARAAADKTAEGYRLAAEAARAEVAASARQTAINSQLGVGLPAKSARDAAAAFEAAARETEQLDSAAAALRAELDPLGAVLGKINAKLDDAKGLYAAGRISALELAKAELKLAKDAETASVALGGSAGAKRNPFGLQSYQLTNLGFQINDVATQLASGTSIAQTFGQQAGQILQIVPGFSSGLATALPALLAGTAAITPFVVALVQLGGQRDQLKAFRGELDASADGTRYQAQALAEATKALDNYGASAKDAAAAVSQFVRDGVAPDSIERFSIAAKNLADTLGISVADAAKQIGPAFTGGFAAIVKFDDQLNRLTASEREHIRALFDSGKAGEARDLAFKIFYDRQEKAAADTRGPWTDAIHDLGAAWQGFLDVLGKSAILNESIAALDQLANAARRATGAAAAPSIDSLTTDIADIRAKIAVFENMTAPGILYGSQRTNFEQSRRSQLAEYKQQLQDLIDQRQKLANAAATPTGDPKDADSESAKKARAEVLDASNQQIKLLGDLTDRQKVRLAGETAYRDAIRETGDEASAQSKKRVAELQEQDRQRKAINFDALSAKIVGVESGGNASAKNPNSTASGLGQFTDATFVALFKKYYPEAAEGRSRDAIIDLKKDGEISKKLVAEYARQNADVLQKAGLAVTEASLYLAHFLGPNGAVKVLSAASATPIASLLGKSARTANPGVLGGNATAGSVVGFAEGKVGTSDNSRAELANQADVTNKLNDVATKYNDTLDQRIKGWDDEAKALSALNAVEALTLQQKFAAQRAGAIAKAEAQADTEANKANTVFTAERRAEIQRSAGALYDLTNAEREHNALLKEKRDFIANVLGLEQQRETALGALTQALRSGDAAGVGEAEQAVADLTKQIEAALPKAHELAAALGDQKAVAGLDKVDLKLQTLRGNITTTADVNQAFTNSFVSGFNAFANEIASGTNVFTALKDGLLTFASQFIQSVAQMIIQALALKLIMKTLGLGGLSTGIADFVSSIVTGAAPLVIAGATLTSAGGTLLAAATGLGVAGGTLAVATASAGVAGAGITAGAIGLSAAAATGLAFAIALQAAAATLVVANTIDAATLFHDGGIAGSGSVQTRSGVSQAIFRGATRYHNGGLAGLRPNEVPAILMRNEEVLTTNDPRHRFNSGGSNGQQAPAAAPNIKIVNAIDSADVVSQGLSTSVGEKAVINIIRTNKSAIKAYLD